MTDFQVGFICTAVVSVAFLGLEALRIWVDHKEEMRDEK